MAVSSSPPIPQNWIHIQQLITPQTDAKSANIYAFPHLVAEYLLSWAALMWAVAKDAWSQYETKTNIGLDCKPSIANNFYFHKRHELNSEDHDLDVIRKYIRYKYI